MRNWQDICADTRALSLRQAGLFVFRRATKGWRLRRGWALASRRLAALEVDLPSNLTIHEPISSWFESKFNTLEGFPTSAIERERVAELIRREIPRWVESCLTTANAVCENRIFILGHRIELGDRISWNKDYASGAVWPAHRRGELCEISPGHGADIKFVWELSRFHNGVNLGRAYALTGEERFAEKFLSLFLDWKQANPPSVGPNWACAMEVAIRAVNLLWAGALVASSRAFNPAARESFVKSIAGHGLFIRSHLENSDRVVGNKLQPVNGNHYLADLAGLLYIGCAFPECHSAAEWREFATAELYREIRSQVDDEGVHWEYCPNYHRLVLEMILGCLILLERRSVRVPDDVREKVIRMVNFIRHYRKPSGDVPLVRDIDNGRFCVLGAEELTNHDHVVALGAVFLDRPDLYSGTLHEECLWQLGSRAYEWHRRHATHAPQRAPYAQ